MLTDHLKLYAFGELPEDLSAVVASHLEVCEDCGTHVGPWAALADEAEYDGPENRKSARVATDDPAFLTILKPERSPRITMRIVDTSTGGLRLQLSRQLMTGTIIQVRVRELFILAEVRYCIADDQLFHAGVQIQDVFELCQPNIICQRAGSAGTSGDRAIGDARPIAPLDIPLPAIPASLPPRLSDPNPV